MRGRSLATVALALTASLAVPRGVALAQGNAPDTTPKGAPPADATALVTQSKAPGEVPDESKPVDGTTATLSAGGQLATGNSRLLAGTINGVVDSRRGANGYGASILGNYGQGAPPGQNVVETAENLQGRLRYDRYVIERASVFLILTGRHDKFQGLDFRLNVDPGFKYLFLKAASNTLWGEIGYDFQYDDRNPNALGEVDASGNPVLDANGNQILLPQQATDHSSRLFVGYRHAFNKEVTLATGLEYLQSFLSSTSYDSRVNFDALFAAKVGSGFSVGLGFSGRFDQNPLPGKQQLDTATTLSLIYAFSDLPEPPKPPCPCPEAPPAPPAPPPMLAPPAPPPPPPVVAPPG
jgi:hypothetical protein